MIRFLVLSSLVAAIVASFAAAPSASHVTTRHARVVALESSVLGEINALRRAHRLPPLRLSRTLAVAAAGHSQAMGTRGFFQHASADGSPFWRRIERHYGRRGFSYWAVGENLLWASPEVGAAETVERWLASPPHRANLLNPQWREIGLSALSVDAAPGAFDGLDVTIVTANFGVRR